MKVRLEFKPEDLWVGVYWRVGPPARLWAIGDASGEVDGSARRRRVDVWVCLLPCLPIHFTWLRRASSARKIVPYD